MSLLVMQQQDCVILSRKSILILVLIKDCFRREAEYKNYTTQLPASHTSRTRGGEEWKSEAVQATLATR